MRNPTALMQQILQSKKAQEIIDWVSPIYGESYVGLWLFEVIGEALDQVANISNQLLLETSPASTEILINYYEDEYGLPHDTQLTIEQRRQRIMSKIQSRQAVSPYVLEQAITAVLGGAKVEIIENIAKNTFRVNIQDLVEDSTAARNVLDQMKPAHLQYIMQLAVLTEATEDINIAMAMTKGSRFEMQVATEISQIGVFKLEETLVVLFGVTAKQTGSTLAIT